MGDTEGLVQVEMTDIRTKFSGLGESNHRVEIRAIEINLSTTMVDYRANLLNCRLKDTMS